MISTWDGTVDTTWFETLSTCHDFYYALLSKEIHKSKDLGEVGRTTWELTASSTRLKNNLSRRLWDTCIWEEQAYSTPYWGHLSSLLATKITFHRSLPNLTLYGHQCCADQQPAHIAFTIA
jgi:hypothetical protein